MALFEKKETAPAASPLAVYDAKMEELGKQTREVLCILGQKYADNNTAESAAGSIYEEEMTRLEALRKEMEEVEVQKLAKQGLRKCGECRSIVSIDSLFCNKCGVKLSPLETAPEPGAAPVTYHCPNCGSEVESGMSFCISCGSKL